MTVRCVFCNERLDPEDATTYRKVVGWERRRTQGGTNALALRDPRDEFACWLCIHKQTQGIPAEQGTLL